MYTNELGGISWVDLTVRDAEEVRDFYRAVIGFETESFAMDGYDDYVMKSPENHENQVGICHARGANADLAAQWLVYFNVADVDQSLEQCRSLGGEIVRNKCDMGEYDMCVIKDPSGAVVSLVSRK